MALYFIVSSAEDIRLTPGTKIGWSGPVTAEFLAWQNAQSSQPIVAPISAADAVAGLTAGVIDIYVTDVLAAAQRSASAMESAFIYDQNGGILFSYDGPGTPSPTDPVTGNVPTEVIVRSDLGVTSPAELEGAAIAVVQGTPIEVSVHSFFANLGISVNLIVFPDSREATLAYAAGRTDALAVADGFGASLIELQLGGASRHDVIDLTLNLPAPGYVKDVALLYEASFAREADIGGLNYWIDRHESGLDIFSMAANFLESAEFTQRFGDDDTMSAAQFINLLYQNVLERPGEAAGIAYWESRMNEGASRERVLLEFAVSPENVQASTVGLLAETAPGYWTFG